MVKRGQIYYADLDNNTTGSEQGGKRPIVILQNDVGNTYSPTTIIAIMTSRQTKSKMPTHYWVKDYIGCGLIKPTMVECEQIRTIDKKRLLKKIGQLPKEEMQALEKCLLVSLGLGG